MACIVNLFTELSGTPDTGGRWFYVSAPTIDFIGGPCAAPLPLQSYAQFAQVGTDHDTCVDLTGVAEGTYEFQYVLPNTSGPADCGDPCIACSSITITVVDAPVDGVPVEYCENNMNSIILYDLLGNTPDIDGDWSISPANPGFSPSSGDNDGTNDFFKPSDLGPGVFTFTYTINSVTGCTNCEATVEVTIVAAEIAGQDATAKICN